MTAPAERKSPSGDAEVPVYIESLAGSLIDSARISVMAALAMLPPPDAPRRIVLPGTPEQMAEDVAATAHGCLEEAMEWLNAARAHATDALAAKGVHPTSVHVIGGAR